MRSTPIQKTSSRTLSSPQPMRCLADRSKLAPRSPPIWNGVRAIGYRPSAASRRSRSRSRARITSSSTSGSVRGCVRPACPNRAGDQAPRPASLRLLLAALCRAWSHGLGLERSVAHVEIGLEPVLALGLEQLLSNLVLIPLRTRAQDALAH